MSFLKYDSSSKAFVVDDGLIDAAFLKDSSDIHLQEKVYERRIDALAKPEDYLKAKSKNLKDIDAEVAKVYKDTFKSVFASTGSEEYSRNAAKEQAEISRRQKLAIHNVTYPDQIVSGGAGEKLRKTREAGRYAK